MQVLRNQLPVSGEAYTLRHWYACGRRKNTENNKGQNVREKRVV